LTIVALLLSLLHTFLGECHEFDRSSAGLCLVPDDAGADRMRGFLDLRHLAWFDTAAQAYTIDVRPFHHPSALHGRIVVHATHTTAFEINGQPSIGAAGLQPLVQRKAVCACIYRMCSAVVSNIPGILTLDVAAINARSIGLFDFAGAGASQALDADPVAYSANAN
jgi:hypothetical protein